MPIVVDPSFVPPAAPSTVESSDLRLTARSDPDHAGAFLKASFAERVLRRNLLTNPAFRAAAGTVEVRRNYCVDPNAATPSAWSNYVGTSSIVADGAAAYSGSTGLLVTGDGTQGVPRIQPTVVIPCAAGEVWTCSVKLRQQAGTGWGAGTVPSLIIRGPKVGGGEWSFAAASGTALPGGWVQMSLTVTIDAATNGTFITNFGFSQGGGGLAPAGVKFHVDEILFEKAGAALPWFNGGTVASGGLTYSWTGTPNNSPSIVTGLTPTSWVGGNQSKIVKRTDPDGTTFCAVTSGTTNSYSGAYRIQGVNGYPVTPGLVYSARALVRAESVGRSVTLTFYWYTATGVQLPTKTVAAPPDTAGWSEISGSATAPDTAAFGTVYVQFISPALGETHHLAQVLVEQAASAGPFFDGATPTAGPIRYRWAGAADASASEEFVPALVNGKGDLPERVRFCRGDGSLVRSGDTALAPGGVAVAYDHGAQLGQPVSWYAVPIWRDGSEGSPTAATSLELPDPTGATTDVWLKSVLEPEKSVRLWLTDPPKMGRAGRVDVQAVRGARNPAASWDARSGYTTSFAVATQTPAERKALEAVLDTGPLLFQASSLVDVDDFYLLPGDVEWAWGGDASDHLRVWTIAAIEVDAPATLDAPLVVPDLSWDTVKADYTSWDQLTAQESSWLALLGW